MQTDEEKKCTSLKIYTNYYSHFFKFGKLKSQLTSTIIN